MTNTHTHTKTTRYRAPALDKGLDILEFMASTYEPLSMTKVAASIGYSKGEIFRMLQVLEDREYIRRGPDGEYVLTNRLFRLGMERPPIKSLVEAALPAMRMVTREAMQPCHLAVISGDQMVVIERIDPPDDIGFVVRVGHRLPLSRSTSGAVLFAFQSEDVRVHLLAQMVAAGTLFHRRHFIALADKIRAQGYAAIPSQVTEGVTDLSAPVLRRDAAVGTLSVPYVKRRVPKVSMEVVLDRVRTAAKQVSEELTRL